MLISYALPFLKKYFSFQARAFEEDLANPQESQLRVLNTLGQEAKNSPFYSEIADGFSDYPKFAKNIPIRNFQDFPKEAQKFAFGKIKHFEPTSGSGGAQKLIPYNRALMRSFQRLFQLWAFDVLNHGVQLKHGKVFISVSPPAFGQTSGLEDDSDYLSGPLKFVARRMLVFNPNWKKQKSGEEFLRLVAQDLMKCKDLEVVSVWNGQLWLNILEVIRSEILKVDSVDWKSLWPDLKLISCWGDAWARSSFEQIQRAHPSVWVQKKGLLSTEAPITLPWTPARGHLPLINEVFLEFRNFEGVFPLWEVQTGEEYEVIVSQKNGLIRYATGDKVRVTGSYKKTPILKFAGRTDKVSDLAGEKLSQVFVEKVLKQLIPHHFALLMPARFAEGWGYALLSEKNVTAEALDQELRKAHHYHIARELGQIQKPRVLVADTARQIYQDFMTSQGVKIGDLKETALLLPVERGLACWAQANDALRMTQSPSLNPSTDLGV